ncbi:type III polyketide synthase [Aeoliella sp. ICT_H6.2]|uniref:Type III polyketide synthase n=1 Tax=Aeoliella straminimaris TaxID=2954799 RepID=A0A9X2FB38_9BACT|nr:type III polyketide synthase [Aeoliella straminimaris]MCO6045605.1 type III polyketide synthase [Aeoliella straminimaris]
MTTSILGIGLALPEHSISQADAAACAVASCVATEKQRQLAPRLYQRSGVQSRHSVLLNSSTNGDPASQTYYAPSDAEQPLGPSTAERMQTYRDKSGELACRAAGDSLTNSKTSPEAITHLVTVSCSGFEAPGFDIQLIEKLGLSRQVSRTHVGFMGCHGALNGLRVAKAFVDADPSARVLLVAVELCSLHYQYGWTNERIVSNSLFADGAAAVVVGRGDSDNSLWQLGSNFAEVVPDCLDAMTWRIGDNGFEMTLSAAVPELIRQHLRHRLLAWLEQHKLTIEEIAGWAIHPGGPRILQACQEALDLPDSAMAASYDVLRRYGNMSSPTVLFVLDTLRASTAGPVVAIGFGPGLAIEACLLN